MPHLTHRRCSIAPLDADALSMEIQGMSQVLRLNGRLSWEEQRAGGVAPPALRQLARLTIIAAEQGHVAALADAQDVVASYDLVAVQPLSEQALRQVILPRFARGSPLPRAGQTNTILSPFHVQADMVASELVDSKATLSNPAPTVVIPRAITSPSKSFSVQLTHFCMF